MENIKKIEQIINDPFSFTKKKAWILCCTITKIIKNYFVIEMQDTNHKFKANDYLLTIHKKMNELINALDELIEDEDEKLTTLNNPYYLKNKNEEFKEGMEELKLVITEDKEELKKTRAQMLSSMQNIENHIEKIYETLDERIIEKYQNHDLIKKYLF